MNRSIRRLYLTLAGLFGALILMLGWWQVVDAQSLKDHSGNQQVAQAEKLIDRGRILSADGKVLAVSRPKRVGGQKEFLRYYPRGSMAAHVVGYDTAGTKTGVEKTYNRYLSGSFGTEPLLQRLNLKEKRGADVRLSIDTRVQKVAEDGLAGKTGAVVALDPRTGAVRALASSPTFSLQQVLTDYAGIPTAGQPLLDRATQGRYPPGSTFKVVTTTAALESGKFTESSPFDDTGTFDTPGGPIHNFAGERFGPHDLRTAFTNSINTTFARIGATLGPSRLGATMTDFGFGKRPPIDLPDNEVLPSGRLSSSGRILPNDQKGEDAARIAIGQERLAVTPLQMALVAATVADGGRMMAPHVMQSVRDRGGNLIVRAQPQQVATVMSENTASALTDMMKNVVDEGTGTGANLSSAGVQVAGKTGTAETGVANLNDAWFIGFAPADNPVIAVAVVVENTSQTGGVISAPIAAAVMRTAIEGR